MSTTDKIRKLLRLAEAGTLHEAEAAARQAQAMIVRHRLTLEDVGDVWGAHDSDQKVEAGPAPVADEKIIRGTLGFHKTTSAWRWALAWAVCRATHCQPWSDRLGRSEVDTVAYGYESDVAAAKVLYAYLVAEIDTLAAAEGGKGRSYIAAFRYGAIDTIGEALLDAEDDAHKEAIDVAKRADVWAKGLSACDADPRQMSLSAGGDRGVALAKVETAIARIDKRHEVVELHMKADGCKYSGGHSPRLTSGGGYRAGQKAGRSVNPHAGGSRLR